MPDETTEWLDRVEQSILSYPQTVTQKYFSCWSGIFSTSIIHSRFYDNKQLQLI